jgi:hypothetical protein
MHKQGGQGLKMKRNSFTTPIDTSKNDVEFPCGKGGRLAAIHKGFGGSKTISKGKGDNRWEIY